MHSNSQEEFFRRKFIIFVSHVHDKANKISGTSDVRSSAVFFIGVSANQHGNRFQGSFWVNKFGISKMKNIDIESKL